MMDFVNHLDEKSIDIWNAPDNQTVENPRFTVKWSAELETRDWGIKSVITGIRSITGTYDLVIYDPKTGDDLDRNEVEFNADGFEIKSSIAFDEWTQMAANGLDIDLEAKTVEVC